MAFKGPKCPVCRKSQRASSDRNHAAGNYACGCNSLDYLQQSKLIKEIKESLIATPLADNEVIRFVVHGNPAIKKNSLRIVMNGIRCSVLYEVWASRAIYQIQKQWLALRRAAIDGPVHVEAHFYLESKRSTDLSNLHEGMQDCLTTMGVWLDDSLIQSHDGSRKHYDKYNPRIEYIIRKFNDNTKG